ncbi:hypothetical protein [Methylobacterium nodulans]|uniref:Uncharacterized protein n=1 Tax=Methylobacterium nodulans (strain LMG 21967 / CNCM I-2342 / ORS 2060) TaxID=460265 RepID=B8IH12_METNO|nr:hypothetical protein [Methylobacterium nodulans]ACL57887.1 hypothetical protein Mnod_2936 [Methylobacterium nodulans ORS 2060]
MTRPFVIGALIKHKAPLNTCEVYSTINILPKHRINSLRSPTKKLLFVHHNDGFDAFCIYSDIMPALNNSSPCCYVELFAGILGDYSKVILQRGAHIVQMCTGSDAISRQIVQEPINFDLVQARSFGGKHLNRFAYSVMSNAKICDRLSHAISCTMGNCTRSNVSHRLVWICGHVRTVRCPNHSLSGKFFYMFDFIDDGANPIHGLDNLCHYRRLIGRHLHCSGAGLSLKLNNLAGNTVPSDKCCDKCDDRTDEGLVSIKPILDTWRADLIFDLIGVQKQCGDRTDRRLNRRPSEDDQNGKQEKHKPRFPAALHDIPPALYVQRPNRCANNELMPSYRLRAEAAA